MGIDALRRHVKAGLACGRSTYLLRVTLRNFQAKRILYSWGFLTELTRRRDLDFLLRNRAPPQAGTASAQVQPGLALVFDDA